MNEPKKYNTPAGQFVCVEWDANPMTLQNYLEAIGEDFFLDNWGYDNRHNAAMVPNGESCFKGQFIVVCTDRPKTNLDKHTGRYMVNNMDIGIMFTPITTR